MTTRERISVDITSSTIFRTALILLSLWFIYLIADILLMLFAAVIIAAAVEPVANYFQQFKIPRVISVAIVYLGIVILLSSTIALLVGPLTAQITQLSQAVPHLVNRLSELFPFIPHLDQAGLTSATQELLVRVGNNITNISVNVFQQTRTFFSGIVTILFIFILAFYLVVERDALKKFARIVTPRAHLPYVEQSIVRAQRSIGRWVLAQLTLAVIVGVLVGVGLWVIGIPYSLVLGLLAGIMEIIPVMGPIIAAIPGVVVGLSQSLTFGVVALVFYVLVQQLENHVLVPNIMRRAIGLNPLVTIIAILLGARLAGTPGVILSVPLATILSIFLSDLFSASSTEDDLPG
ncbi:MAG: AI-2E family transporter [Candidatus Andersenbacteria bacterium]